VGTAYSDDVASERGIEKLVCAAVMISRLQRRAVRPEKLFLESCSVFRHVARPVNIWM
jgi:hypothetical protein